MCFRRRSHWYHGVTCFIRHILLLYCKYYNVKNYNFMHSTRESNKNFFWFFFAVNATPPKQVINNIVVIHLQECDTIIYNTFTIVNVYEECRWYCLRLNIIIIVYLPTSTSRLATRFRPLIRRYWNEILSETAFRVTGSGGVVGGDPCPAITVSHLVDHTFPSSRLLRRSATRQPQAYTRKPHTPPLPQDRPLPKLCDRLLHLIGDWRLDGWKKVV